MTLYAAAHTRISSWKQAGFNKFTHTYLCTQQTPNCVNNALFAWRITWNFAYSYFNCCCVCYLCRIIMKMSCQSTNITLRSLFILKPEQDNKVNGLFMDLERVYRLQNEPCQKQKIKIKSFIWISWNKTMSVIKTFCSNIKICIQ